MPKEKQHEKTIKNREKYIARHGTYIERNEPISKQHKRTMGKLFKWNPKSELSELSNYGGFHTYQAITLYNFNSGRVHINNRPFYDFKNPDEFVFVTPKGIYIRKSDKARPELVAVEVYSVELGFVYADINNLVRV